MRSVWESLSDWDCGLGAGVGVSFSGVSLDAVFFAGANGDGRSASNADTNGGRGLKLPVPGCSKLPAPPKIDGTVSEAPSLYISNVELSLKLESPEPRLFSEDPPEEE